MSWVLRGLLSPVVVTVTARTRSNWYARFVCACGEPADTCRCTPSSLVGGAPDHVAGGNEGRDQLVLPRAGYLVLNTLSELVAWQVDVMPADPAEPGAPRTDGAGAAADPYLLRGYGIALAVPIERPEPGRLAIAEIDVPDPTELEIETTIRTADGVEKLGTLIAASKPCHGRRLLAPAAAHLRVTATRFAPWSVLVSPLSAAIPLDAEWRGMGDEILFWDGGPAAAPAHANGRTGRPAWRVGAGRHPIAASRARRWCFPGRDTCDCAPPARATGTSGPGGYPKPRPRHHPAARPPGCPPRNGAGSGRSERQR